LPFLFFLFETESCYISSNSWSSASASSELGFQVRATNWIKYFMTHWQWLRMTFKYQVELSYHFPRSRIIAKPSIPHLFPSFLYMFSIQTSYSKLYTSLFN
jgi:hypothetical protein